MGFQSDSSHVDTLPGNAVTDTSECAVPCSSQCSEAVHTANPDISATQVVNTVDPFRPFTMHKKAAGNQD